MGWGFGTGKKMGSASAPWTLVPDHLELSTADLSLHHLLSSLLASMVNRERKKEGARDAKGLRFHGSVGPR